MEDSGGRRSLAPSTKSIGRFTVSCFFVFVTQLSLALVPTFFSTSSLLPHLCISAAVLLLIIGLGGRCRRLTGVSASAPAYVVVSILYTWSVYIVNVRQAVSTLMDVLFNGEISLLMVGLCRMFNRDPGLVAHPAPSASSLVECQTESHALPGRVRFCRMCKAHIKGYDHHCPAFGNCIGQDNHSLFMALLLGFLVTEASFVASSYKFLATPQGFHQTVLNSSRDVNLAYGAMLFSLLQLLWQLIFFTWHVYCVFFNIRTEEWVNWRQYPEFQVPIEAEQEQGHPRFRFMNPYNKGILRNIREFLGRKE